MRKRQNSPKGRRYEENPLEEFEAYGEYSYAYKHEKSTEESEGFEEDENQSQWRGQRIPLEKEAPKKKRHSLLARLIFLLVCAVVGLVILQETVFRLKTVYVIGNESKTPQQVTEASGLVKGLNIFAINDDQVRRNLSRDHTIEFIKMQKEYPSTIYLYISERKSIAAFQWLGMQYMLDPEGLVMSESNSLYLPEGVPVVTGFDVTNIHVGQRIELKDQRQMLAYQAIMSELRLQLYSNQISELNVSDSDNLYLMTIDGITVRLGNSDHARAKVGALRTDMACLRQLGKAGGILDISIPEDAKYTPDH